MSKIFFSFWVRFVEWKFIAKSLKMLKTKLVITSIIISNFFDWWVVNFYPWSENCIPWHRLKFFVCRQKDFVAWDATLRLAQGFPNSECRAALERPAKFVSRSLMLSSPLGWELRGKQFHWDKRLGVE